MIFNHMIHTSLNVYILFQLYQIEFC